MLVPLPSTSSSSGRYSVFASGSRNSSMSPPSGRAGRRCPASGMHSSGSELPRVVGERVVLGQLLRLELVALGVDDLEAADRRRAARPCGCRPGGRPRTASRPSPALCPPRRTRRRAAPRVQLARDEDVVLDAVERRRDPFARRLLDALLHVRLAAGGRAGGQDGQAEQHTGRRRGMRPGILAPAFRAAAGGPGPYRRAPRSAPPCPARSPRSSRASARPGPAPRRSSAAGRATFASSAGSTPRRRSP